MVEYDGGIYITDHSKRHETKRYSSRGVNCMYCKLSCSIFIITSERASERARVNCTRKQHIISYRSTKHSVILPGTARNSGKGSGDSGDSRDSRDRRNNRVMEK